MWVDEWVVLTKQYISWLLTAHKAAAHKQTCLPAGLSANSLVVRRFASSKRWMIRSVVAWSEATGYNEKLGICRVIQGGLLKPALLCREYQRLRRTSSCTLTPKAAAFLPFTQCGVYGASTDALLLWVQVMSVEPPLR